MELFLGEDQVLAPRASWVVNYCVEAFPELLLPYLERMLHHLRRPVHDAVKRNTVRAMQFVTLPDDLLGRAADECFRLLASPAEPVGIKACSMSVLESICRREPELKTELKLLLEEQMPYASPGFTSRAGKILKNL
jgi:hypothetical protein